MLDVDTADCLCHQRRNGVTHLSGLGFESADERVRAGERLEAGGFADADGPILRGVAKSSISIADAPGRQTGRGAIPSQSAVDLGMAVALLMAMSQSDFGQSSLPPPSGVAAMR